MELEEYMFGGEKDPSPPKSDVDTPGKDDQVNQVSFGLRANGEW